MNKIKQLFLIGDYVPQFNMTEFQKLYKAVTENLTTALLVAIPSFAILAILIYGGLWFLKDEDEREQKPIGKVIKKIVFWTVVLSSITTIFKLFGL